MKLINLGAAGAHGGVLASTVRDRTLATVSALSMIAAGAGVAQAQTPAQSAQSTAVEEIVVTGTRVVRDGYEAPTPLTVVGVEQIQNSATSNIADFVNTLPSMAGMATPQTSQQTVSAGTAGINTINLRNIGTNRTLVLLDGQRNAPSTVTGSVDVNNIPQTLISRVDIVTGGASAAYGSDALAGVVNFVLDKKFTGIKGEVSGGVTTYGDDRNWKVSLTAGIPFAADRGHVLLSGEAVRSDGILVDNRDWNTQGAAIVLNPNYGTGAGQSTSVPQQLVVNHAGIEQATPGSIITSGPLKGIYFGPGGVPAAYNYGTATSSIWNIGGDWASTIQSPNQSLDSPTTRQALFTRAAYDITDNINVYLQYSWNYASVYSVDNHTYNIANIIIKPDNAFIPASVAAQVTALKLTSLLIGTMNDDLGVFGTLNNRTTRRLVAGADGKFGAFDTNWTWSFYFQKGVTHSSEHTTGVAQRDKYSNAIDAVRNPANGMIVCRVTLTNANSGCVPWNLLGIGVNSAAGLNYVYGATSGNPLSPPGQASRIQHFEEDVYSASMQGEPFSTWAGPVSLAFGAERRLEKVFGVSDRDSLANNWQFGNFLPNFGRYTVTEGFVETVIPLAKDAVWARSFDVNAAIRATSYSTSGYVTTWKVGATWAVIDDIRFRGTRSRDIRAPNLSDLFAAGTANTNTVFDRFNNNLNTQYQGAAVGNAALKPEAADTTGLGVVLTPQFFPGFSASFDYYNITINDAIGSVTAQQIVDFCFQGNQVYCPSIIRGVQNGVNVITQIRIAPFNFVTETDRGYDIEASYRTRLDNIVSTWAGDLSIRFLATHYLKNYTNNGINPATDRVGQNNGGVPRWRYVGQFDWTNDPITVALTARGVSAGVYNTNYIQCTSGCPVATTTNPTQDDNHLDGALYFDLALSYKFAHANDDGGNAEAFLNVRNLMNTDPVIVHQGPGGSTFLTTTTDRGTYDSLGRVFRVGVRFKM